MNTRKNDDVSMIWTFLIFFIEYFLNIDTEGREIQIADEWKEVEVKDQQKKTQQ